MPHPQRLPPTNADDAAAPLSLEELEAAPAGLRSSSRTVGRIKTVRRVVGGLLIVAVLGLGGFFGLTTATSWADFFGTSVSLPTPIPGVVTEFLLDVGDRVEPGQVLAVIYNARVDLARLSGLRTAFTAAQAKLAAVRADMANTTDERDRRQADIEQQRSYQAEDLSRQWQAAQAQLAALSASQTRQASELHAVSALSARQLVSRLDLERAHEAFISAAGALGAQSAALARLDTRRRALQNGVYLETPFLDQQARLNDLSVHLARLQVQADELTANLRDLDRAVRAEEEQVARLTRADIRSPVGGYVWRRRTNPGQFVPAGADIVEVVDASSVRVEAYFHQKYLRGVVVGGVATVLPTGSRSRLKATVQWIGSIDTKSDTTDAPHWEPGQDMPMRVILSIDERDRDRVWIGQRAKVIVASAPASEWGLAGLVSRDWLGW